MGHVRGTHRELNWDAQLRFAMTSHSNKIINLERRMVGVPDAPINNKVLVPNWTLAVCAGVYEVELNGVGAWGMFIYRFFDWFHCTTDSRSCSENNNNNNNNKHKCLFTCDISMTTPSPSEHNARDCLIHNSRTRFIVFHTKFFVCVCVCSKHSPFAL